MTAPAQGLYMMWVGYDEIDDSAVQVADFEMPSRITDAREEAIE